MKMQECRMWTLQVTSVKPSFEALKLRETTRNNLSVLRCVDAEYS